MEEKKKERISFLMKDVKNFRKKEVVARSTYKKQNKSDEKKFIIMAIVQILGWKNKSVSTIKEQSLSMNRKFTNSELRYVYESIALVMGERNREISISERKQSDKPKRADFNPPTLLKCPVSDCYEIFKNKNELESHISIHARIPNYS